MLLNAKPFTLLSEKIEVKKCSKRTRNFINGINNKKILSIVPTLERTSSVLTDCDCTGLRSVGLTSSDR